MNGSFGGRKDEGRWERKPVFGEEGMGGILGDWEMGTGFQETVACKVYV